MTKSSDPVSVWSFFKTWKHKDLEYDNSELHKKSIISSIFKEIISKLIDTKIFIPNKIEFPSTYTQSSTINLINGDLDEVIGKIVAEGTIDEYPNYILIRGNTFINNGLEFISCENIVSIYFDFESGGFEIATYSDCWVPIDREDNLQIIIAELNAPRLEKILKDIKSIGSYDYIIPDENEEEFFILPQKGFKIFMDDVVIDYVNLSAKEKKIVEKYLWSNR